MNIKSALSSSIVLAALIATTSLQDVHAATLVDDPFIDSYNNWVATNRDATPVQTGDPPTWGIHLLDTPTMMENSDERLADGLAANDGNYTPWLLVQDSVTTGSDYNVSARMYTSDDDGFGLVFGYQDDLNYYRVGMREQSTGSLGFTRGLSVQKVVGGVVTQISPAGTGEGDLSVPTQSMIDNRTPIDISVGVVGTSWSVSVAGINGGSPIISGSDENLTGGKTGILSWGQRRDTTTSLRWGTEATDFTVKDGSGTELFSDDFKSALPVTFRELQMTNAEGGTLIGTSAPYEDLGIFHLRFPERRLQDDSNGFEYGTETAPPNTDFIGPAVVVDDPGSGSFSDYEMKVRMSNDDNDGMGVLVRVQDDDTFYRITICNQGLEADPLTYRRSPSGVSVQKAVSDGGGGVIWSELYRDDQNDIPFLPGVSHEPFDLKVIAVGNKLKIEIIEDPDGTPVLHTYPVITDNSDPLLTGTVGFHNWGSGSSTQDVGIFWSAYGGIEGTPLLIEQSIIPEPGSVVLLLLGAIGLWGIRRK